MMSPFDSSGVGSRLGTRVGARNFMSHVHVPPAHAAPDLKRVDGPESNPVPSVVAHTHDVPARRAVPASPVGLASPVGTRLQVEQADDSACRAAPARTDGSARPVVTATVLRFPQRCETAAPKRLTSLLAKPVVVGKRRSPGFRPGDPRLRALASALLQVPFTFKTNEAAPLVASLLRRSPRLYGINHFRYDLAKLRVRNLAERIGTTHRYRLTRIGRLVCEVIDRHRRANDLANARSELSCERRVVSA